MTVSLALRGDPRIPRARRDEICRAAKRLGYAPDPMAVALAQQRRSSASSPVRAEIAWINCWKQPERLRSFREFDLYWRSAEATAAKHGFHLEEFVCHGRMTLARVLGILEARNVMGVLVPPHGFTSDTAPDWRKYDWSRRSVIRFGYSVPMPAVVASSNHTQGCYGAAMKIRQRGYRRIGYICNVSSHTRGKAGFLLFQSDLAAEQRLPILVLACAQPHEVRRSELGAWLKMWRPDALLSEVAEVRTMLDELGCRVPDDVGLAATSVLDGNADAGILQHSDSLGRVAVENLISLMYHNVTGFPALGVEILINSSWCDGRTLPIRERLSSAEVESCHGSMACSMADVDSPDAGIPSQR